MAWDPFQSGQAKEDWDPFRLGLALEDQSTAKNVGHSIARGALDDGAGSAVEGAARLAAVGTREIMQGMPGTDLATLDTNLGRLKTRRREMLALPPQFSTFAGSDEGPHNPVASEEEIGVIDREISDLQSKFDVERERVQRPAQAVADKTQEFRKAVREEYPIDRKFEQSTTGGVIRGASQVVSMLPALFSGIGLPAAAGQLFDQSYGDAKASGADDETAIAAGVANLPSAVLEFASDKLQLGGLMKAVKAGKLSKNILAREIVKRGVESMAGEGATEAAQQVVQNVIAKGMYDKDRKLSEGVLQSGIVGGLTGGIVGAGSTAAGHLAEKLDTGRNIPESPETLHAQQEQLVSGRRPAQMFPKGTDELELPAGMQRVETDRGIFHFDPAKITPERIHEASAAGRENEILAMGPTAKADVAASGEHPITIAERTPAGAEVKAAVTTPSRAAATAATLEATKTPGNEVAAEAVAATAAARPGFVGSIVQGEGERQLARATKERSAAEDRAQRQQELAGKRASFGDRIRVAREVFANPQATYPEVQGALQSVRFYSEDNSLGLTQEQREQAKKARAALESRVAAMQPAEDARRQADSAVSTAQQRQAEEAQKAARSQAKQDFRGEVAAGKAADGSLDYNAHSDDALAAMAQKGDKRAEQALMRRGDAAGDTQENLLQVLERVKLPMSDAALGGELKGLREFMSPAQAKKLFGRAKEGLDSVAEVLRADEGFSAIKTPADVIDFVQRALRGEDIRPDRGDTPQTEFATRAAAQPTEGLTDAQAELELGAIRKAFPALTRNYDVEIGIVEGALRDRGYGGQVPKDVEAAVMRLKAERSLIVLGARAYRDRAKGASLLSHEVAHTFWDTLPADTRETLAELHRSEVQSKTGPLYRDGKLQSELEHVEEMDGRGQQEWFAERIARLNEDWARGRIDRTEHSMLKRIAFELREYVRKVWSTIAAGSSVDPDGQLFVDEFRKFFLAGADEQVGRAAGAAYAQRQANFAKAKGTNPKDAAKIIADAERVPSLPQADRKGALISQLERGRKLRDEGNTTGNFTAETEGVRMVRSALDQLDEEFPGWDKKTAPAGPAAAPVEQTAREEQSPFDPAELDAPMPVRPGRFNEVYGHSATEPTFLARSWAKVRAALVGIKGAIPELPTFPAAFWNKSDTFIRANGAQFYNRIKEGLRALRSGNDYVQRLAEDKVGKITRPLLAAASDFSADDYRRQQKRQEQVRRLTADKQPVPAGVRAEIAALESKLESSPYVLFERVIVALDLNWRQENLKDSEGNPIRLPANVNPAEVKTELQRLGDLIEAHPQGETIKQAVKDHMALVKQVADDLHDRELMEAEQLDNPFYFPHVTLETTRGDKTVERELRPERVRPGTESDFRGYLIDPVGSAKAIETDYVRAMYFHLVQVGAHNLKADVVRDFFKPYDIRQKVEERAKQLSKQRGVPVSWEQAWHEEFEPAGYVLYGKDNERDMFSGILVDRDRLAQRLGVMLTSEDLHAQLKRLGLDGVKLLPGDLQETMMQGSKETWIVPARVAEALRGVAQRETRQDHAIESALKGVVGAWKFWKLFMPWNHIRYEYGNIVADLEKMFSSDPKMFKYLAPSAREIREFWKGGAPSADLRAAVKEGVINTITANEMARLVHQPGFEVFETKAQKAFAEAKAIVSAPLANATRLAGGGGLLGRVNSVEESAFREAVFRYAKFKGDLEAMRNGARPSYGGAYWKDIDSMTDSAPGAGDATVRKAAAISKSTFGDYGDLSVGGEYLRSKLIPFWSWTEVNFKYHANLFRNMRDMVRAGEASRGDALKAKGRAAGAFAAGFTARAAGGMVLRLSLPYLAAMAWNNSGDRDELEEQLSDEDRRRFHIIVGEIDDGADVPMGFERKTLRDGRKVLVTYANTAFMDVAKWFSGPAFAQAAAGWMNGRTDFPTALSKWKDQIVPDFVNNTAGSFGPLLKIPIAVGLKKNTFPDVLDARTIPAYDLRRVVIGQMTDDFTADIIERTVSKDYYASKDFGAWARQLILQARERDPDSWAFYEIKDKANDFYERETGRSRDSSFDAPDQQVLRNFRRAIYRGDIPNATRFYLRLLDYGYTAERFQQSIRSQDPLSALSKESGMRQRFVASLSPVDRRQLERAFEYYERIDASRGRERTLFPSDGSGARGQARFQANPPVNRLQSMMQNVDQLSREERMRRAEMDLRRSLRR